ncbi:MAG: hypothetical protein KGD60_07710 [Candidatus Thorarchaeota archaeon]|nr:hypothetical protein [Candidatus Thorarchaeota archaeon]
MAKHRFRVELDLRERLAKKGLSSEVIEEKVRTYMKRHDLKEKHRKIHLAGKSGIEKAKANVEFEVEVWPKIREREL